MYEFAAAEGVKVHPNGVSLVMPKRASQNGSAENGASAASNGSAGKTLLKFARCLVGKLKRSDSHVSWISFLCDKVNV